MAARLNANALVDLDSFKSFVDAEGIDEQYDPIIKDFLNASSDFIEKYCYRRFTEHDYTEAYSGDGTPTLHLNQWPVTEIKSVSIDVKREFSTPLDSSQYDLLTDQTGDAYGIEFLDGCFPEGQRNILVNYKAGYTLAKMPSDIKLACTMLSAYYYEKREGSFSISSKTKGDEVITYIQGIPKDVIDLISKYKRVESQ